MEEEKGQQFGEEKKPIIKDKFHITYIIHFILGAGNLVPWNSFVTAVDYFDYLYPNRHIDKRKHTEVAFGILVFGLIICGLADGLTSGSLMGVTGELPGRYMQATITGNASSGIVFLTP
ncbi:hypothetical protein M9H77_00399 [Catharanthus roseus]|nr:hypothetical protein M9H77_00399 [Catharanthus roseus]